MEVLCPSNPSSGATNALTAKTGVLCPSNSSSGPTNALTAKTGVLLGATNGLDGKYGKSRVLQILHRELQTALTAKMEVLCPSNPSSGATNALTSKMGVLCPSNSSSGPTNALTAKTGVLLGATNGLDGKYGKSRVLQILHRELQTALTAKMEVLCPSNPSSGATNALTANTGVLCPSNSSSGPTNALTAKTGVLCPSNPSSVATNVLTVKTGAP
ncbi:unnamed protein product [Nezara viridula]|uniref:Uncharacterized protein n=1 Tax=Nezara viridula TaxID=85310 RepID=A0A9P0HTF8_NEZVI|nr:unnamed protein product [Nezara viridula]